VKHTAATAAVLLAQRPTETAAIAEMGLLCLRTVGAESYVFCFPVPATFRLRSGTSTTSAAPVLYPCSEELPSDAPRDRASVVTCREGCNSKKERGATGKSARRVLQILHQKLKTAIDE